MSALEEWREWTASPQRPAQDNPDALDHVEELAHNAINELLAEVGALREDRNHHRRVGEHFAARLVDVGCQVMRLSRKVMEAEAERDRLAWMLERIRDSEYDRMSDADALADLAARYDARHEDGDG